MKVELLKTLKGEHLWGKGTVLDDSVAPFPRDIQEELKARSKAIRILPNLPHVTVAEAIGETVTAGMVEGKEEDVGATEQVPELNETPTETVASEIETESITNETPAIPFPELEGLIQLSGSLAGAARKLGVTYVTVNRWRQRPPRPDIVKRIKREYKRLIDDQRRADDAPSGGTEGPIVELG